MIKRFSLLISALYSLSAYASDDVAALDQYGLTLCNSSDINIIFVFDVGHAKLYLPNCEVLDYSEFMLAITYHRAFTAEEFRLSSDELISRNNSAQTYTQIKTDLGRFNSHYQAVEAGDEYRISYTKKQGLNLQKNGQTIASSDSNVLAQAYFKVWFGDRPFHKKMKRNLLNNIQVQADTPSKK